MNIMCMACDPTISLPEKQYGKHMQDRHGGLSQSEAMQQQKNIPKQQTPIALDKAAPPTDDFMEVAKMLDKPKEVPPVSVTAPKAPARTESFRQEERKPLILKYRWEGNCEKCNVPVRTVVVKAKGQTVAVALCLDDGEVEQREVADLEDDDFWNLVPSKTSPLVPEELALAKESFKPKRKEKKDAKQNVTKTNKAIQPGI
jgi:hypothetical protein